LAKGVADSGGETAEVKDRLVEVEESRVAPLLRRRKSEAGERGRKEEKSQFVGREDE
jgi:hypothetical protein